MDKYKFQWSIKLDNGEIYVVCDNDFKNLQLGREEVLSSLHPKQDYTEQNKMVKTFNEEIEEEIKRDETEEDYCLVHKLKMKARNGKNGVFYSHSKGVYPDLDWCSGNGFKNEQ